MQETHEPLLVLPESPAEEALDLFDVEVIGTYRHWVKDDEVIAKIHTAYHRPGYYAGRKAFAVTLFNTPSSYSEQKVIVGLSKILKLEELRAITRRHLFPAFGDRISKYTYQYGDIKIGEFSRRYLTKKQCDDSGND